MLTEIECMNHLLMVEPSKVLKLNQSNFTEIGVEIAFPKKTLKGQSTLTES